MSGQMVRRMAGRLGACCLSLFFSLSLSVSLCSRFGLVLFFTKARGGDGCACGVSGRERVRDSARRPQIKQGDVGAETKAEAEQLSCLVLECSAGDCVICLRSRGDGEANKAEEADQSVNGGQALCKLKK